MIPSPWLLPWYMQNDYDWASAPPVGAFSLTSILDVDDIDRGPSMRTGAKEIETHTPLFRMRTGGWPAGILLALLFALAPAASADAQDDPSYRGTAEDQMACTPDVFRLCWNEIPFVSRIVDCLRSNRAALSPACRTVFQRKRLRHTPRREQPG
jgi:hypothetical protein